MSYYFEVTLWHAPMSHVLVKAENIIEAGEKAESMFGWGQVTEITRTKIEQIID